MTAPERALNRNETLSHMRKAEEKTMSRASIITLGVVLIALVLGIGYYSTYQPTGGLRAECTDRFNRLDTANDDDQLEYGEFQAYGEEVSPEEFAKADADKNESLNLQEFCSWTGAGTERG